MQTNKHIKLNVKGEVFDVHYEDNVAIAVSRKDETRRFEADCVYSILELIRKSDS